MLKIKWFFAQFFLLYALFSLSGCQLVKLSQNSLSASLTDKTQSILTRQTLSDTTQNTLLLASVKLNTCLDSPAVCVEALQHTLPDNNEQLYAAASEIYLARALKLSERAECKSQSKTLASAKFTPHATSKHSSEDAKPQSKQQIQNHDSCLDQVLSMLDQSIRYSYAYLFKTELSPQTRIFDQRQTQVRLFYNVALSRLITTAYTLYQFEQFPEQLRIHQSVYRFNFDQYPELKKTNIELLESSYNMRFSGFYSVNRRDGFGSEFVLVAKEQPISKDAQYIYDPLEYYKDHTNPYIHHARYLSVTAVAQPKTDDTLDELLAGADLKIQLIDPLRYDEVEVNNKAYLLTANYSAPYGLWLANNDLGIRGYKTLIDRHEQLSMPHLFMVEPYNPNKKIIIFVHGLASSPEAWISLTNDIMGEDILRKNYQVWQVFHSTNMPILESRYQIYALLKQAFAQHSSTDPAMQNALLIGHSMGGLISRLMVSESDVREQAVQLINQDNAREFIFSQAVSQRFIFKPIPNISRVVFIATPHRGTPYAERWFTRALRRVILLPNKFLQAVETTVADKKIDIKKMISSMQTGIIDNGPSDLSYQSKFMQMTKQVLPTSQLHYHSIIGNITQSQDPKVMTDGIVPYTSAHLAGAESEKIIPGGHSIQMQPEAIVELRRILKLHAIQPKSTIE